MSGNSSEEQQKIPVKYTPTDAKIFKQEQEEKNTDYLKHCSAHSFGLTIVTARQYAFEYASSCDCN